MEFVVITNLAYCQCCRNGASHRTWGKRRYSNKCAPTWQTNPARKLSLPVAVDYWHTTAFSSPLAGTCQFRKLNYQWRRHHITLLSCRHQQRCMPEFFISSFFIMSKDLLIVSCFFFKLKESEMRVIFFVVYITLGRKSIYCEKDVCRIVGECHQPS